MTILGFPAAAIAIFFLALLGIGGVLYAFFYNAIENEQSQTRRLSKIKAAQTDSRSKRAAFDKAAEGQKRRKAIAESLSDLDEKNKDRQSKIQKPGLKLQIQQAGLKIEMRTFYIYSAICGVVFGVLGMFMGAPLYIIPGIFFAAAFGVPRWVVGMMRARRMSKFLEEFPNSIDIIVRAIKSGLPLNDGLRLIATEAKEPVRSEFRRIVEGQQLGLSTPESVARMYESMPLSEANFFAIVIQIQAQAGGNLSEALGNLSKVLRARKTMKAKVAAMSMEAKASAAIIGALPVIVTVLVYLSSPEYIMLLFTTDAGLMILGVSAVWMGIGIFVMRQMINFEV
ncbi:MAG: type II secretion system F family protein [Pseudomonadota bacterium]